MKIYEKHLDIILSEIGEFGTYQRRIVALFMSIIGLMFFTNIIFIFEAKPVNHRCLIPNCENETSATYSPPWLVNAVPFKKDKPERCSRYQQLNDDNSTCAKDDFNTSTTEKCEQFVYETPETTIMHDFNLHCDENVKKLTFIGTVNGIGKFIGLPIAGCISDRYGRKKILIYSMVLSGLSGIIRSFATSYNIFLILKFFDSLFISGAYASVYVLAAELVGPGKRVLVYTFMNISYGLGSMVLGGIAWLFQSWRIFVRIIYSLFLLCAVCKWLVPESVRWLMTKKRHEKVKIILKNIAEVNGKSISYSSFKKLTENVNDYSDSSYPLKELLMSCTLVTRCICCSFCWISCIFVYYGLSITSVTLSGNTYLDFILSCLIEVPACLTTFLVVDRIGRRLTLSAGFSIASVFSIILIFVPKDMYWVNLAMFLGGKYGITITMNVIYMITNEMFPTSLRQTLLSLCSMFGRLGNIAVPQLLLLQEVWKSAPYILFAILTGIATFISISFPETKNIVLPDTVEEAENLGRKKIRYLDDIDL